VTHLREIDRSISAARSAAVSAFQDSRYLAAHAEARRALALLPDDIEACRMLAASLFHDGRVWPSLRWFRRLSCLAPHDSRHQMYVTRCHLRLRDYASAAASARRVLLVYPSEPAGLSASAQTLMAIDRAPEAETMLLRLEKRVPSDRRVKVMLQRCTFARDAYVRAERWCRAAMAAGDSSAARLLDLGRILRAQGRPQEAQTALTDAVALDPGLALDRSIVELTMTDEDFKRAWADGDCQG
jgi:tetratricopeptide (TPR) repeat protein